jgi:hypothetical protein
VHWNHYLNTYVALLNRTDGAEWAQEGIYVTFSSDLVNWTNPEKLFESNDWYPQVVGLGVGGSDSRGGRFVRLFVGGISTFILEFVRQS